MHNRRQFLAGLGTMASASALATPSLARQIENRNRFKEHLSPQLLAENEDFWHQIKSDFTVSPNLLILNNGGVSPQPKQVQDAHIRYYQYANEGPSYYMWRILDQGREALRTKLANLAGCSPDELAVNRNATEGLNTIIFGLDLKRGDEVVLSKQDYPNMINAWKQREKRDGIRLVWVNLECPNDDESYFFKKYTDAFTERTKIVHITHLINWVGQVTPVRKIADEAHQRGIEVLVDGAHSFAHLDFKISDLGCDYFATSLHKWLCAPFGSGLMYVQKDKIQKIWALLSNDKPDGTDIRKFESLGTRSFASEMAIGVAADYHNGIGSARKQARLHYLQRYWTDQARQMPGVKIHTSQDLRYGCAIALVSIDGLKATELDSELYSKHRIHAVGIDWENIHGVRITPHIYTSIKDLDRLVAALDDISGRQRKKG